MKPHLEARARSMRLKFSQDRLKELDAPRPRTVRGRRMKAEHLRAFWAQVRADLDKIGELKKARKTNRKTERTREFWAQVQANQDKMAQEAK
jgi:hypothetical protein